MHLTPVEMLARLVAFPTVSRDSNLDLVAFVKDYLAAHGVAAHVVPSPDGQKANIYATVGPDAPGGVILSGHTDVVPVDGQVWTSDPWTLVERGGKLYGRGTCDMKGFDAICLALVPEMIRGGLERPIHLALSYDEEVGCTGVVSMIEEMRAKGLAPSAVIVGEPSRMKVVTGHKGGLRHETKVRGKAVHSSRIDQGVSAIHVAARLVVWHEDRMRENARDADPANPFEPPYTTLHCGLIQGGAAPNIAAEHCAFTAEIRAIPGDDPWGYLKRYEAYVRDEIEPAMKAIAPEAGVTIEIRNAVRGLSPEPDGAAEALCRRLTGDNGAHVVAYGTEGGLFQAQGWSTVVCGPGDIAQAHQPDEYIEVSEMEAGAAFVRRLIANLAA
jgi:acetylornithine deacetylase